jgi:aarF domain-containing kinase
MIFRAGFVHSDPHPGNLFIRKDAEGQLELVLLDHGIYVELSESTRLAYTKLWRGILSQDEQMIKGASKELGADLYELFTAMIT